MTFAFTLAVTRGAIFADLSIDTLGERTSFVATTPCDAACLAQRWTAAIEECERQVQVALPMDALRDFDPEVIPGQRMLKDGDTVLMTTWSKYEFKDGVQKYELWTTLKDEFYPRVAGIAGDILSTNSTMTADQFRISLNNSTNILLGMNTDAGIEEKNIRKLWVAEVPVLQADVEKVVAGQATEGFFRPCLGSPSISTESCQYQDPQYKWIKNWIKNAWDTTPGATKAYPFTGEGYTYNWSQSDDGVVGLQEYVLPPKASNITFVAKGKPIVEAICDFCSTANSLKCKKFKEAEEKRSEKICNSQVVLI